MIHILSKRLQMCPLQLDCGSMKRYVHEGLLYFLHDQRFTVR